MFYGRSDFYGFINNTNSNTLISGTSGDDTIRNVGESSGFLFTSAGRNFTINTYAHMQAMMLSKNLIYATADTLHINDKEISLGRKTITFTSDNNNISVLRDSIGVLGNTGNNFVYNNSSKVTINTDAGNDTVVNNNLSECEVIINTGDGNDSVSNYGDSVTINGGSGNDSILGNAGNDKLFGGVGNDTLFGDAGNDTFI